MFTYSGLSTVQVDILRTEYGIYMVRSGRICVSGLSQRNIERVAQGIAQVYRQH